MAWKAMFVVKTEILLPRKTGVYPKQGRGALCFENAAWHDATLATATGGRQDKMAWKAMFVVKTEILLPRKTGAI